MFADLVPVAGHIYKHGIDHGLPAAGSSTDKLPINLHTDEFNELKGGQLWKIRMSLPKPSSGDAQESYDGRRLDI